MKMVCLKEFRYAGKQLYPGDSFDAHHSDVRVLRAIKKADLVDGEEESSDSSPKKIAKTDSGKRTYKRRDMKAE